MNKLALALILAASAHADTIRRPAPVLDNERLSAIDIGRGYQNGFGLIDPVLYFGPTITPVVPGGGQLEITMPDLTPTLHPEPPPPPDQYFPPTPPIPVVTPEPTALLLAAIGCVAIGAIRRKQA